MCGIAGILSSDIDLRGEKLLVEKMGKTLNKRGPDSAGLYLTPQVAMLKTAHSQCISANM